MQDRFLRDGILDEMIDFLRHLDMRSWPRNEKANVVFASIIHLYQLERKTLETIEARIEVMKEKDESKSEPLVDVARLMQKNLTETLIGIQKGLQSS